MKSAIMTCLVACGLTLPALVAADNPGALPGAAMQTEVDHALGTLSRYTVFDDIEYRLEGNNVTLLGEVTQPVVKDDAESAVKSIAGIGSVTDQIEVLPLSPMDQQLRLAVFRAIYGSEELNRYQGAPSIHILVKNGELTLAGSVMNQMDREIAGIKANQVPGVFHVTNNLKINTNL